MCACISFVSAIIASRAAIISSASGKTPSTPNFSAILPAFIAPLATDFSSQCADVNEPTSFAFIIPSLITFEFTTGIPSSENAIAPASFIALKSTNSSPFSPFVIDENGSTLHKFTAFAFSIIIFNVSTLSGTGFVFGIGQIVVNPPATALFEPVSIVSLYSNPGSLR